MCSIDRRYGGTDGGKEKRGGCKITQGEHGGSLYTQLLLNHKFSEDFI